MSVLGGALTVLLRVTRRTPAGAEGRAGGPGFGRLASPWQASFRFRKRNPRRRVTPTRSGTQTSSLEETYRIERTKWDEMAQRAFSEANLLPPHVDFEDFARKSGMLIGVADFFGDPRGKRVLEYGCGLGKTSVLLAKSSAEVSAFDLSPISVQVARKRAKLNGLELDVAVAAGEKLPYPDESFDVVFGRAILHHLDVGRGWGELYRVLKPGERAAFVEPMGMNPILNFVRDHVPYPHKTPRGADRPLTYKEIRA